VAIAWFAPSAQGRCLRTWDFCIPEEVTLGQKVTVVVNYIERHVEDMHLSFGVLAHEALKEAWPGPCKPDQPKMMK
jgi:hypothetical protein